MEGHEDDGSRINDWNVMSELVADLEGNGDNLQVPFEMQELVGRPLELGTLCENLVYQVFLKKHALNAYQKPVEIDVLDKGLGEDVYQLLAQLNLRPCAIEYGVWSDDINVKYYKQGVAQLRKLVGSIDIIISSATGFVLADVKTGIRGHIDAKYALQLAIYAYLFHKTTGHIPEKLLIISIEFPGKCDNSIHLTPHGVCIYEVPLPEALFVDLRRTDDVVQFITRYCECVVLGAAGFDDRCFSESGAIPPVSINVQWIYADGYGTIAEWTHGLYENGVIGNSRSNYLIGILRRVRSLQEKEVKQLLSDCRPPYRVGGHWFKVTISRQLYDEIVNCFSPFLPIDDMFPPWSLLIHHLCKWDNN